MADHKKSIRRGVVPVTRTASEPLHVMVEPDRMARYRATVEATGLSLREWVTSALDAAVAQHQLDAPEIHPNDESTTIPMLVGFVGGHSVRLRQLETELEALRKYVSTMMSPGGVPRAIPRQ